LTPPHPAWPEQNPLQSVQSQSQARTSDGRPIVASQNPGLISSETPPTGRTASTPPKLTAVTPSQPPEPQLSASTSSNPLTKAKGKKKTKGTPIAADFVMLDLEWYKSREKEEVEVDAPESLTIPSDHAAKGKTTAANQAMVPITVDPQDSAETPLLSRGSPKPAPTLTDSGVKASLTHRDSLQEAMKVTEELLSDLPPVGDQGSLQEVEHDMVVDVSEQVPASILVQSPVQELNKDTPLPGDDSIMVSGMSFLPRVTYASPLLLALSILGRANLRPSTRW
jgi:hypothetical protein